MTMQRLCHAVGWRIFLCAAGFLPLAVSAVDTGQQNNDYPTHARVEYVNGCLAQHGNRLAALYQCSCAIDWIAARLGYDAFVEAATFSRYASLGGESGGIFRDSEQAQKMTALYHKLETQAHRACGLDKS